MAQVHAKKIRLEVVTPAKRIIERDVDEVDLPGANGEFGVLPQHSPFFTMLGVGVMRVVEGGKVSKFVVNEGFAEVSSDRVIVLTETCEAAKDIDLERAKRAKAESEAKLKALDAGVEEYQQQWKRMKRAAVRVEVGESADF